MISPTIQLVYKYIITRKEEFMIILLLDQEGRVFANEYFTGKLRKECVDFINSSFLQKHYEKQAYYIEKHFSRNYKKGSFKRADV